MLICTMDLLSIDSWIYSHSWVDNKEFKILVLQNCHHEEGINYDRKLLPAKFNFLVLKWLVWLIYKFGFYRLIF